VQTCNVLTGLNTSVFDAEEILEVFVREKSAEERAIVTVRGRAAKRDGAEDV
jgi:hypothetical protein